MNESLDDNDVVVIGTTQRWFVTSDFLYLPRFMRHAIDRDVAPSHAYNRLRCTPARLERPPTQLIANFYSVDPLTATEETAARRALLRAYNSSAHNKLNYLLRVSSTNDFDGDNVALRTMLLRRRSDDAEPLPPFGVEFFGCRFVGTQRFSTDELKCVRVTLSTVLCNPRLLLGRTMTVLALSVSEWPTTLLWALRTEAPALRVLRVHHLSGRQFVQEDIDALAEFTRRNRTLISVDISVSENVEELNTVPWLRDALLENGVAEHVALRADLTPNSLTNALTHLLEAVRCNPVLRHVAVTTNVRTPATHSAEIITLADTLDALVKNPNRCSAYDRATWARKFSSPLIKHAAKRC